MLDVRGHAPFDPLFRVPTALLPEAENEDIRKALVWRKPSARVVKMWTRPLKSKRSTVMSAKFPMISVIWRWFTTYERPLSNCFRVRRCAEPSHSAMDRLQEDWWWSRSSKSSSKLRFFEVGLARAMGTFQKVAQHLRQALGEFYIFGMWKTMIRSSRSPPSPLIVHDNHHC